MQDIRIYFKDENRREERRANGECVMPHCSGTAYKGEKCAAHHYGIYVQNGLKRFRRVREPLAISCKEVETERGLPYRYTVSLHRGHSHIKIIGTLERTLVGKCWIWHFRRDDRYANISRFAESERAVESVQTFSYLCAFTVVAYSLGAQMLINRKFYDVPGAHYEDEQTS